MKKIIFTISVLLIIILGGCNYSDGNETVKQLPQNESNIEESVNEVTEYEIDGSVSNKTKETYESIQDYYNYNKSSYVYKSDKYQIKPIIVKFTDNSGLIYPEINIDDDEIERRINNYIYEYIFHQDDGSISSFLEYDEDSPLKNVSNVGVFLDYEVTYYNTSIIAIAFRGVYREINHEEDFNIFDNEIFSSDNELTFLNGYDVTPALILDIKTGKKLALDDLINLEEDFMSKLTNMEYTNDEHHQTLNYVGNATDSKNHEEVKERYLGVYKEIFSDNIQDFGNKKYDGHFGIFGGSYDVLLNNEGLFIIHNELIDTSYGVRDMIFIPIDKIKDNLKREW